VISWIQNNSNKEIPYDCYTWQRRSNSPPIVPASVPPSEVDLAIR
jgi:hypothetical protein